MVTTRQIEVNLDELAAFCQRNHIKRLAFFGSVLREDFRPDSDVDVLYEFEEGHVPGLEFVRIVDDLSRLLADRKLDMVSYRYINPRLRERILSEAQMLYDAT